MENIQDPQECKHFIRGKCHASFPRCDCELTVAPDSHCLGFVSKTKRQDPTKCKLNDGWGGCLSTDNDFVSCRLANAFFTNFTHCPYYLYKTDNNENDT